MQIGTFTIIEVCGQHFQRGVVTSYTWQRAVDFAKIRWQSMTDKMEIINCRFSGE
jgi:hypothetical protein